VVALEDAEEPAALLLDASGLSPLWAATQPQGEQQLLQAVDRWSRQQQLIVSAALAQTPGLAWAGAHFSAWLPDGSADPRMIANENSLETAQLLPIESLRIDEPVISTLVSLGIERIGQLLALPKADLLSRFGPQLGWRLDQLLGKAAEPLSFYEADQPLVAEWPFETAVRSGEVLDSVLRSLLDRLTAAMQQRRCGALRVQILYHLETSQRNRLSKSIELRLFRPSICPQELAELAALQISDTRFSHAVKTLRVQIVASGPLEMRQKKLFDDQPRQNPHELAMLINRLSSRVGAERVLRIEKQASHDPSRCFRYLPATEYEATKYRLTTQQAARMRRLPLAFYGHQSKRIEVGTEEDHAPRQILLQRWRKVVRTWGPERVETGWWRGRGLRRDAYWIELTCGARLWLLYDRHSQQWRCAGEFY
jgi:protein ImuB